MLDRILTECLSWQAHSQNSISPEILSLLNISSLLSTSPGKKKTPAKTASEKLTFHFRVRKLSPPHNNYQPSIMEYCSHVSRTVLLCYIHSHSRLYLKKSHSIDMKLLTLRLQPVIYKLAVSSLIKNNSLSYLMILWWFILLSAGWSGATFILALLIYSYHFLSPILCPTPGFPTNSRLFSYHSLSIFSFLQAPTCECRSHQPRRPCKDHRCITFSSRPKR